MRTRYPLNKIAAAVMLFSGLAAIFASLAAQSPTRSLWDGVYTQDQAKRGQAAYTEKCARCHGADLGSGDSVPALAGTDFLSNWNMKTVGDLFDRIRTSMPADKPGSLTHQQDADIVAYILSVNKFPDGKNELDTDSETLKQIQFDAFKQ